MSAVRDAAHNLIDRLSDEQLTGLLLAFGEEYFSEEEIEEIRALREENERTDWREVRADV